MAPKTTKRQSTNKRPRTPSAPPPSSSSESSLSPYPGPRSKKRQRSSKSTSPFRSGPRSGQASRKASKSTTNRPIVETDDGSEEDDDSDPSSEDESEDDTTVVAPRASKGRQSDGGKKRSTIDADGQRRKSLLAQLGDMDDRVLEDLLSSRSKSKPNSRDKDELRDGQCEDTHNGGLAELDEDDQGGESEDEEAEREMHDRAEELSAALAAPFDDLYAQSSERTRASFQTLANDVYASFEPFQGIEVLEQLRIWRDDQIASGVRAADEWDKAAAIIADRSTKMGEVIGKIRGANEEKAKLIAQARKDCERIFGRQEAEMARLREELEKGGNTHRAKLVKATDKGRISKAINIVMTQLMEQNNG